MQRFISFGNDVYTALIIQSRYSRTVCLYAMHLRANKNHQGYSVYTESMIPESRSIYWNAYIIDHSNVIVKPTM